MEEQCSSDFIPFIGENETTSSPFSAQQSTLVTTLSSLTSRECMHSIQIGFPMALNECMDSIAKLSGIQNPMEGHMSHTFRYISANMTNELLTAIVSDYCDLFKVTIKLVCYEGNTFIVLMLPSLINQPSLSINNQQKQRCVFIFCDVKLQSFAPLDIRQHDGSQKMYFDDTEEKMVYENIYDFLGKRNVYEHLSSTSDMSNHTDDVNSDNTYSVDPQFHSTLTMPKPIGFSNKQSLWNADDLVDQFFNTTNNNQHFSNISNNNTSITLYDAKDTFDAFEQILLSGFKFANCDRNHNQYELTGEEKKYLANLVRKDGGEQNLKEIASKFAESYNIYLYFIADNQGKYRISNEEFSPNKIEEQGRAFVVLNSNDTVGGVLFAHESSDVDKQAVFAFNNQCTTTKIEEYIEKLNQSMPDFMQENSPITLEEDLLINMLLNDVDAPENDFNSQITGAPKTIMEIASPNGHAMQQIIQINNASPELDAISPSIQKSSGLVTENHEGTIYFDEHLTHHTYIVQRNESEHMKETNQTTMSLLTHLPSATQDFQTSPPPSLEQFECNEPVITNQPKEGWKIQYTKGLMPISTQDEEKMSQKKRETKSVALLQGEGPEQSRVKVQVSPPEGHTAYLAINVRTIDNQPHSSKIIVPDKTKVNGSCFNRENDLKYLEFDECNPMYYRDPTTGIIYIEITPENHPEGLVEVAIYMFNLYQTQSLTRAMIQRKHLNQCKLAFWLCLKRNQNYIPISGESLSRPITEK